MSSVCTYRVVDASRRAGDGGGPPARAVGERQRRVASGVPRVAP